MKKIKKLCSLLLTATMLTVSVFFMSVYASPIMATKNFSTGNNRQWYLELKSEKIPNTYKRYKLTSTTRQEDCIFYEGIYLDVEVFCYNHDNIWEYNSAQNAFCLQVSAQHPAGVTGNGLGYSTVSVSSNQYGYGGDEIYLSSDPTQ